MRFLLFASVDPETVIIPILCSIFIFPVVASTVILLLRYYNRRARAKEKFRYVVSKTFFKREKRKQKVCLLPLLTPPPGIACHR